MLSLYRYGCLQSDTIAIHSSRLPHVRFPQRAFDDQLLCITSTDKATLTVSICFVTIFNDFADTKDAGSDAAEL